MTTYVIGEIAMLQRLVGHPEFNGMKVIIASVPYRGIYMIDFTGFEHWTAAYKRNLRKIDPPFDDASKIGQATLDVIERARRGAEVEA